MLLVDVQCCMRSRNRGDFGVRGKPEEAVLGGAKVTNLPQKERNVHIIEIFPLYTDISNTD